MAVAQADNSPQRQSQTDTVEPDSRLTLMNNGNIKLCDADSNDASRLTGINTTSTVSLRCYTNMHGCTVDVGRF